MEHEMPEEALPLRTRLNAETAQLAWSELETFFARGVVIRVAPELDLVEVAARVIEDDKAAIEVWLLAGQMGKPDSDQARDWHERSARLWAVVAAPWILVQEKIESLVQEKIEPLVQER